MSLSLSKPWLLKHDKGVQTSGVMIFLHLRCSLFFTIDFKNAAAAQESISHFNPQHIDYLRERSLAPFVELDKVREKWISTEGSRWHFLIMCLLTLLTVQFNPVPTLSQYPLCSFTSRVPFPPALLNNTRMLPKWTKDDQWFHSPWLTNMWRNVCVAVLFIYLCLYITDCCKEEVSLRTIVHFSCHFYPRRLDWEVM